MSDTPPPLRVGDRERRAVDEQLQAGQRVQGYAVMGKAVVDLRRDDLPRSVDVQVRSLMGEIEVMVPPGSAVHLSGFSVMGERKVQVGAGDGPDVHVDAVAVMGTVKVTVGDGTVVATGHRPGAVPAPWTSSGAVPQPRRVHRSGGHLSRRLGRAKGLLVPAALLGALVLAGPDNVSIFEDDFERVGPDDREVQISTLFASTTVVVPDDRTVDFEGFFPFGSRECEGECATGSGEVVDVRTFGGFGSVEVMTASEYAEERARDRAEERREELEEQREDRED